MLRDAKQRLAPEPSALRRWALRLGGGVLLGAGICAAAAATACAASPSTPATLSITKNVRVSVTPDQPDRATTEVPRLLSTITGEPNLTLPRDLSDRVASPMPALARGPVGLHPRLDGPSLDHLAPAELPGELPDLLPGLAARALPALLIDEPPQGPAGAEVALLQRVALSLVPSVPAAPTGPRPTGPVPALPAGTGAGAADSLHLQLGWVSAPSLAGLTPSPLWWTTADPSGLHPRDRADAPPFTPD
ncbi:hypothetical protein ACIB24_13315 [Spongisporangium articulatum]|uniref:Uncharacterized protein n=1 Tax=Spongisporangium articulatum TaxID=3362603 RepID=A0ABW8ANT2_9ACTN